MDPLSISASIAGLVSLADLVFRYSTKYVKGFRGARKEVEDLSNEVKNLSVVLHNLSLVAFGLEASQSPDQSLPPSSLKPHHLHDCQQLLRKLQKGLCESKSQIESDSRFERLQERLKWPFSSGETKELLQDVQRHKRTIDLALAADSLSKLNILLSRHSDTQKGIDEVQKKVDKILDISTNIIFDERRKRVLEFFTKANPRAEFETNRNLRHNLTGLWLTEGPEFEEWYTEPGSRIWCSGIPGAGKSVLAAALVEECLQRNAANPGIALAYFFCTYRDERTHDASSILSCLCAQLAQQHEGAFKILQEYHDELTSSRHLAAEPSTGRLIEILRSMCLSFDDTYIIVDGLDECGDRVEATVKSVAHLLTSEDDKTLNLALLSRDELPIRDILHESFHNIEIEAHTEDVQLYVAWELEQRMTSKKLRLGDLSLKDQILARLVDGAKGMFRWVACQLDHLCELPSDRARRKALDRLPPTLFATYERILTRIDTSGEEVKQLVQRTLMLIGSPFYKNLSLKQICEAVSLDDDSDELFDDDLVDAEEILRHCRSLVRKTTHDSTTYIQFAHFSVQEYLQGDCLKHPTLSAYGVSRDKACRLLGSLCLRYLTLKNHERLPEATESEVERIKERSRQRPFYCHAATFWPRYVHDRAAEKGYFLEHIQALFQPSKTPSFCSWMVEMACQAVTWTPEQIEIPPCRISQTSSNSLDKTFISAIVRPDFTPLHMAALLGMPDICSHLLERGATPDTKSRFGTPLHCAIAGLSVFSMVRYSVPEALEHSQGRRLAAEVLLQAGAQPALRFSEPRSGKVYSSLSLVAILTSFRDDFGIASDLIKAGCIVEEEDLKHFLNCYKNAEEYIPMALFSKEPNRGKVILSLLKALAASKAASTAKSRLFAETLQFVQQMYIETPDIFSTILPMERLSNDEIFSSLCTLVTQNDADELSRFLNSSRADLVKSCDLMKTEYLRGRQYPFNVRSWGLLHLAVYEDSLDVLKKLLEFGVDVNKAGVDGVGPVHLCCDDEDEDALRVLLRHGASTILHETEQKTVWHSSAASNSTRILKVLLELDERDEALKMVYRNETPICAAMNRGHEDSVMLLFDYCSPKEFWKSGRCMLRAAAGLRTPKVVQLLVHDGVEAEADDTEGNPLHSLHVECELETVEVLKKLYPLHQRRQLDDKTPLEAFLHRAASGSMDNSPHRQVLEAMIPSSYMSNPREASILLSFVCQEILGIFMISQRDLPTTWLKDLFAILSDFGIARMYEEERKSSALFPLVSCVVKGVPDMYRSLMGINKPPATLRVGFWNPLSEEVQRILNEIKCWTGIVQDPAMSRLLSLAILQEDVAMISLLLEKGANMHSRVDQLSPFDFACFAEVPVDEELFKLLLHHAKSEEISQGIELLGGIGALHLAQGNAMKSTQLLQRDIDPNLPLSPSYGSPLVFHISKNAIDTAEILLDAGADPWARAPSDPFDAALEAAARGHTSILAKIMATQTEKSEPPCWELTWHQIFDERDFVGGNALHRAAIYGQLESLKFYLDHNLLSGLESCDNDEETPMHYAARFGQSSVIRLLKARGGNIDARNRHGQTPLHLAAEKEHLEAVTTLISLGAKDHVSNDGCTPLASAYATGNQEIVDILQNFSQAPSNMNPDASIVSRRGLNSLADGMLLAVQRGDLATCKRIHALGCPIDMELNAPYGQTTPLEVALCEQKCLVAEWLLERGATVSVLCPSPSQGEYLTVLDLAIRLPTNNSLLPKLLAKYLEEGGDLLRAECSPLHNAIDSGNIEGFRILMELLRKEFGGPEQHMSVNEASVKDAELIISSRRKHQDHPAEGCSSRLSNLATIVNKRETFSPHRTALHYAASLNEVGACAALIDSGANFDQTDGLNETPLHRAARFGCLEAARYLIGCGARPDPLDLRSRTPLLCACETGKWELVDLFTKTCQPGTGTDCDGRNILHTLALLDETTNARFFSQLLDRGMDIHQTDYFGASTVHYVLTSPNAIYLQPLLSRDHRIIQAQRIAQWPDIVFDDGIFRLVAVAKNLRVLRPFLSKHEIRQLSGLAEPGNHSLLCRAACWGSVEAIQNLVAFGADVLEHQCEQHGTPLKVAVSNRQVDAAKCLVRNGAKVPNDLCQPRDSRISMANPDFEIRQWLFVGRYLERKRILIRTADKTEEVKPWAGIRAAEVPLQWDWKKGRNECDLEYLRRRHAILKSLRGQVVKPARWAEESDDG